MKSTFFATALLLMTVWVSAQENQMMPTMNPDPKLVLVVNKADWCPVCKSNGDRASMVLMAYNVKGVNILMNDLTNETSKSASLKTLESAGVAKAVAATTETGVLSIINPKTHKLLRKISPAESDENLRAAIEKYLK